MCVSLTGDHASCGSSRQRVRRGMCVSLTGDHASCGSSRLRVRRGGVVSDQRPCMLALGLLLLYSDDCLCRKEQDQLSQVARKGGVIG